MSHGENTVRPWHQQRLAKSKDKDCDRQPNQYVSVQHMNEGRCDRNAEGVDSDVRHTGRVLVVVRDRESLSHGEGEQFKLLGVQTI